MFKIALGMVIGGLTTTVGLLLFGGLLYLPAKAELIKNWREIQPGMTTAQVESVLGAPDHVYNSGDGFPEWVRRSVPKDYWRTHGCLGYLVKKAGPQILLVFTDQSGQVTFVSSVST